MPRGRILRELHHGQLGVPEDGGQQVVEVVGDAAGQQGEAVELLSLGAPEIVRPRVGRRAKIL
jgi:hypothetical protein